MPIRALESRQLGSLYVEAAFSLPIFLGVLYVSIFLSMLTLRQLSTQFIATQVSEVVRTCVQENNNGSQICNLSAHAAQWRLAAKSRATTLINSEANPVVTVCSPYCTQSNGTWSTSGDQIAGAGDLYHVVVQVPLPRLFGGTVPFFGLSETHTLQGSVLGVFERGSGGGEKL